jgi:uncharacterized protein HemY
MTGASAAALLVVGAVIGCIFGIFVTAATPAFAIAWQEYRKQVESRKRIRGAVSKLQEVIAGQAERKYVCSCDTCTGERIAREVLRGK